MGRVYNALVKADRLPGRERPIGRPASADAVTPRSSFGGSTGPRGGETAKGDKTAKAVEVFPAQSAAITTQKHEEIVFSFNHDSAASAPTFQSDGGFNLTETFAAPRPAEPRPPALRRAEPRRAEPQQAEPLNAQPDAESFIAQSSATSLAASAAPPLSATRNAARNAARTTSQAATAPRPVSNAFEEPREIASISSLTLDPHLVALTAQDRLAQERYRTLAVRVISAASRRKLKTLVVTSAEEGEGKSTVATNLAWSMAKRSERRVILVDANLLAPSTNRMLGLASSRGWLGVADDLTGLADVIVRLDPNGLYVITSGARPPEASRQEVAAGINDALISSRFEKLLAELQRRFDFVVIDAPPVLGCADAQHLASIADGTLIVARAAVTHHSRVSAALALVPEDRRVGIVLNESEVGEESAPRKARRSLIDRLLGRKK